jgi:hypothetical protein
MYLVTKTFISATVIIYTNELKGMIRVSNYFYFHLLLWTYI